MATSAGETAYHEGRFARFVERVTALRRHRAVVVFLVAAAIAGALTLDQLFVSYPVAGLYLVPVTLAALTLRVRATIVVGIVCLGLGVYHFVVHESFDGPTIMSLGLSALSGAALIALSYLFTQVVRLYKAERSTTATLESLAAQLQTLQEVVVLDTEQPLPELLGLVIGRAEQLLGSDGCRVYRRRPDTGALALAASTGASAAVAVVPPEAGDDPVLRSLREREPVTVADADGTHLAVPLFVRGEGYGVLALDYREERAFGDLDVRLAASFGALVALAIENARLREEIGKSAAADERSRLARDLHDSVTQSLFAASLKAEAIRRRWKPKTEEARRNVEDVERLARGALAEMRTLLLEMRPHALAEASLDTLIELLAAAIEGSSRVAVHVDVRPGPVPQDVSVAMFRIAQEALQNVARHSGASEAWVMLDASGPVARLSVRDDGHGFDAARVTSEHLGLAVMRERAEGAGVAVRVESAPGRGTTVTAEWRRDGGST